MEIYLLGNRLFMIVKLRPTLTGTVLSADWRHWRASRMGSLVDKFQQSEAGAASDEVATHGTDFSIALSLEIT